MSAFKPKPPKNGSISDRVSELEDRSAGLEENFTRFLVGAERRLQRNDQRLDLLEETVDALKELNGSDEVDKIIMDKRVIRARAEAELEKSRLEEGIADGYVILSEVATENSLLVGRYLDKDGVAIEPGRIQLAMPNVAPQFREMLVGKGKGTVIDIPAGNKFEVLDVYTVDEEKTKEVVAAKQQAALDAAAAASKADEVADASTSTSPVVETPVLAATADSATNNPEAVSG